jgi:uncharacterized protein YmfQ (DUF2313 family)
MPKSPEEISFQLATKLSPPGALASGPGTTLRKMWMAIADEFSRLYGRIDQLLRESHPSTVDEMLEEWEKEFALPDPCVTLEQSEEDRRGSIASRFSAVGGATKGYFINVAANLGVDINITEEQPFEIGRNGMGDAIGGLTAAFMWTVTASDETTAVQRQMLECIFNRIKPAHTTVRFYYV